MKYGGLFIIVLALLLAGAVAFLINEWMDSQQSDIADRRAAIEAEQARLKAEQERLKAAGSEAVPALETVPVLVAAKSLPVGTRIQEDSLKHINLPPEAMPEGAFSNASAVIGEIVIQPLSEGEIILPARLTQGAGVPLAVRIRPGMRAITLNVDDTSTLAGMLEPESRVDVIPDSSGASGEDASEEDALSMQNIKVLAIGRRLDPGPWQEGDASRAVTLEVTPRQALTLARESNRGGLRFILRNSTDTDTLILAETKGLTLIRGTEQCTTQAGQNCQ